MFRRESLLLRFVVVSLIILSSLNILGHDEHGSQDEGESDGNLSSPGSQGNGEFWTRGPSPSPLSGLGKDTVKHKTEDAGQEENGVEDKPPKPFSENVTHNTSKVPCKESAGTLETGPADDFVSKVVIPDKNKQVEISDSVQHNSDESEEKHKPEEAKEGSIPGSAAETSRDLKIVRECSEEKVSSSSSLVLSFSPPVFELMFSFLKSAGHIYIYAESFAFWSTSWSNLVAELLRFV